MRTYQQFLEEKRLDENIFNWFNTNKLVDGSPMPNGWTPEDLKHYYTLYKQYTGQSGGLGSKEAHHYALQNAVVNKGAQHKMMQMQQTAYGPPRQSQYTGDLRQGNYPVKDFTPAHLR